MCCDYRIALLNTFIGLNEVAIGLAVPKFWALLFVMTVSSRARAEELLASGCMVGSEEAQRIGLINKIVREGGRDQLESHALNLAPKWVQTEQQALCRADTKLSLRRQFAEEWRDFALDEARKTWGQLSGANTIRALDDTMKKLNSRKQAKM